MIVYVVLAEEDWGSREVAGIFSSREKAQQYLDSQKDNPHQPLYGWEEIEEWKVDQPSY